MRPVFQCGLARPEQHAECHPQTLPRRQSTSRSEVWTTPCRAILLLLLLLLLILLADFQAIQPNYMMRHSCVVVTQDRHPTPKGISMLNSRMARERAERHFTPESKVGESPTARQSLAATARDIRAKSDRLRALRLARDLSIAQETVKSPRKSTRKRRAPLTPAAI